MPKKPVTLDSIKADQEFASLIRAANKYLEVRGYTEHGLRHVGYVSKTTANILSELGFDERMQELGAIAGWIHDIGNSVNREMHGLVGASLAYPILARLGMPYDEINTITVAIGNHEEGYGLPSNAVSAALIIADKSDAHRTRVRKGLYDPDDIHDRVNYAIKKNYVVVDKVQHLIRLVLFMDNNSSLMEYFQIYLSRMVLSEKAATFLGCSYELMINDLILNRHRLPKPPSALKLTGSETNVSEE
jgi:metal-dependent HD superfamily phosphatase/phosphodiesterase